MSNTGGGKVKQTRKKQTTDKPYSRRQSLLSRVTDTVKDILSPSWLVDIVSSVKKKTSPALDRVEEQNDHGEDLEESYLPPRTIPPQMPPYMQSKNHPSQSSYPSSNNSSILAERPVYGAPLAGRTPFSSFKPDLHSRSTPGNSGGHIPFPVYKRHVEDHQRGLPYGGSLVPDSDKPDFQSEMLQLHEAQLQQLREDLGSGMGVREEGNSAAVDKSQADMSQSLSGSHLWSTNEVSKPQQSVRTQKPSFNVSIFGSPSKNTSLFGDQSSPYYPGRTTFGGATSHRKNRLNSTAPYQTAAPLRRQVKAKPLSNASTGVTSSTAKKILETLERMSTPLNDAKKIPASSISIADSPLSFTPASYRQRRYQQNHSLTSRSQLQAPPVMKLNTPSAASIAKNRQRFPEVQLMAQASREPEKVTKSTDYKVTDQQPMSNKSSGKMKRERAGHYSRQDEQEQPVDIPDLPTSFQLPVSSMPKFDFKVSTGESINPTKTAQSTQARCSMSKSPTPGFSFSDPIPQGISETPQGSISPVKQDFKFSSPIAIDNSHKYKGVPPSSSITTAIQFNATSATTTTTPTVLKKESNSVQFGLGNSGSASKSASQQSFGFGAGAGGMQMKFSPSPVAPRPKMKVDKPEPKEEGGFKPAAELKSGSVMDILGKGTTTTTADAKSGGIATAAELKNGSVMDILGKGSSNATMPTSTLSSVAAPSTTSGWGNLMDKFQGEPGSWDCDICMVKNKAGDSSCVACQTAKPGSTKTSVASTTSTNIDTDTSAKSGGFGDLFKKPKGSWECGVCLVMNKPDTLSCAACQTANPNSAKSQTVNEPELPKPTGPSLSSLFKKASGSWECDTCMVQNKPEATKCAACETPKPGSQPTAGFTSSGSAGGFKFGTEGGSPFNQKEETKTISGITFGVSNTISTASSTGTGFKFGVQATESSATGGFKIGSEDKGTTGGLKFGFGTDNKTEERKTSDQKSTGGFKFGYDSTNTETNSAPTFGGFKFGQTDSKSVDSNKDENGSEKPLSGGFKFGVNSSDSVTSAPAVSTAAGGFSFGNKLDKTQATSSTTTPVVGGFSFGAPKPSVNSPQPTASVTPTTTVKIGTEKGKSDAPKPLAGGFSFGKTDTSSGPALNIGAKADETKSSAGGFSFGLSGQTAPPTGGFNAAEKSSPLKRGYEDEEQKSGKKVAFGSEKPTDAVAPSFNFTAGSGSQAPALGGLGTRESTFGSGTTSATSMAPLFGSNTTFGSTSSSTSTASSNLFGTSVTTPAFGGTQGTAPPAAGFGTSSSVFGAGATPSFGAPTTSASSVSSGTVFGNSTAAFPSFGATPGSTPAFGSAGATSNDNSKNAATPVFGSGFGSTGTSGAGTASFSTVPNFQFGQTAAPITFGAKPQETKADSSSGQAFGSAGSTGFNFNATPNTNFGAPQAPSFNATPNFNFAGGSQFSGFSAAPAVPDNPFSANPAATRGRTIRKAARRLKRN